MSTDSGENEKKLHIDEDWKSRVEAEKAAGGEKQPEPSAEKRPPPPLPPPTLTFLASTLYLQGAVSLGLLPDPRSDKAEPQIDQARHAIDLLAMLQLKTEGNRTAEESAEIEGMLHQLRMAYVSLTTK